MKTEWILIYFFVISLVYGGLQIYFGEKVIKRKKILQIDMEKKIEKCFVKYTVDEILIENNRLKSKIMLKHIKENYTKAKNEIEEKYDEIDQKYEVLLKRAKDYKINISLIYGTLMLLVLAYSKSTRNWSFFWVQVIIYSLSLLYQIKMSKNQYNEINQAKKNYKEKIEILKRGLDEILKDVEIGDIFGLERKLKNF